MMRLPVKKYNLKIGFVISLFVSLMGFVPYIAQNKDPKLYVLVLNTGIIFIFCFISWIFNMYLISTAKISQTATGQLFRIAASFFISIVTSFVFLYFFRSTFGEDHFFNLINISERRIRRAVTLFRGSFLNAFLYFIAYVLFLSQKNQQALVENERLKHENLEARLSVLKQQLSPHFLFNSLGILSALTENNKARKYIQQLSNIYRYLLNSNESHLAELRSELGFIQSYLYVLQERFEDALRVTINIPDTEGGRKLPAASLQLLIENAIKHNVASAEEPLYINVYLDGGYIVVSNNINPRSTMEESNGIGLYNIAERYKLLSDKEIIIKNSGDSFTVKLPLL